MITPHYPKPHYPERGAFVERLVRQWEELNVDVSVVAPDAVSTLLRSLRRRPHAVDVAGSEIVRPPFISVGNATRGRVNTYRITRDSFTRAALRGIRRVSTPDVYYGKFLFRGGEAALRAGRRAGRPAFADLGESWSFRGLEARTAADAREIVSGLSGLVCVSSRLREEMLELGAEPSRVIVAPNDVDLRRFRRLNRVDARRRLNLDQDQFIVAFTGHFVERKGAERVRAAIDMLETGAQSGVKGVFFGRGEQVPTGPNVLYAGSVPNEELPVWLNAADLFVLPTLREGHCNAINEAVACGLPVISSDIADVRHQVDPSYSVLVDPTDVRAIATAISDVRRDPARRAAMSDAAVERAHNANGTGRAATILQFLSEIMERDGRG